jgi:hypothetical protein
MAFFQTIQFALLPQISFISLISLKPSVSPTTLELEQEDFDMFQKLQKGVACIKEAMQLFLKRKWKTRALQGDPGEDE